MRLLAVTKQTCGFSCFEISTRQAYPGVELGESTVPACVGGWGSGYRRNETRMGRVAVAIVVLLLLTRLGAG